ncbi:hypothetical protein G6F56_011064 [Rhizopus delemar]|uniref:Uncharacterized protein n=1 Tax=Rhizopus stolonifer TaxID=4846 RepID=A0A367IVA3_RHIST|nr:hypothetical protein G6F56_011064 [Rhizopus delemar]RCH81645.1 hypothetical protein CU098_007104 [Rhizopus stolonifer]
MCEKNDLVDFEKQIESSLPSVLSSPSVMKRKSKDQLMNALLIKESEVFALKQVIDKWRARALEAESVQSYYSEQLDTMQAQYENEITVIEEEYMDKLNEKDDIIFGLRQELHYFAGKASQSDSLEDLMDEFDNMSTKDSIYDRNIEQDFTPSDDNSVLSFQRKTKSEDILDSIQHTVKAIEQELRNHSSTLPTHHRRSLSASTLIETPLDETCPKKIKKMPFYNVFKVLPKMLKRHSLVKKSPRKHQTDEPCPLTTSDTQSYKTLPA